MDSELLDYSIIDEIIEVSDEKAFKILPSIASKQGFLAGLSSGAVAYATKQYAQNLCNDDCVVIIFGDSGRSYLTKNIFAQIKPSDYKESVRTRSLLRAPFMQKS